MVVVRMLHAVLLWLQQRQHVGSSNDDNDPKKMLSSRRDVFLEQLVSSGLWSQLQPALWVVVPSPDPLVRFCVYTYVCFKQWCSHQTLFFVCLFLHPPVRSFS